MANSLEDAIAALFADAKSHNKLLRVAPAAKKLAEQFPGTEPDEIAQRLIDAGLKSYVNIEMRLPEAAPSGD
jgi:hypothetical protein